MSNELPVKVTVGLVDEISQKLENIKNKFPELSKTISKVRNNFDFVQESTKGFRQSIDSLSKNVGKPMKDIGSNMTKYITLPVVAAAGYSVKKFMDIENALTEVQGAANLSGKDLQDFGKKMGDLSANTTFSQEELLKLAAASGEAGVRGSANLEQFSITMAKLGKTAKGIDENAILPIRKILELTGAGEGKISNFGSALTTLENDFGLQAGRVLESTQAITREISKFGLSSTQTLGLAAAIEPLGFEAKQASMAVGEAFRGIDDAIRTGGIKMQGLQKITGMTSDELKKTFKEDPQAVFNAFLNGLNKIEAAGGQTGKALDFFGASGDKTRIILTALAHDSTKLNDVQSALKKSFDENTALNEEYNDASKTLAAQMKKLHNNVQVLSTELGNKLAPFVEIAVKGLTALISWFREHPTIATFVAVLAGVAAVLGPIIFGIGSFLTMLPGMITGFNILTAATAGWGTALWAALAPILIVLAKFILIAGAIALVVGAIWYFRDAIKEGLVKAWDWVIEKIQQVIQLMKDVTAFMSQGFMKFTPLGAMAFGANKLLNMVSPSGPESNTPAAATNANSEFMSRTNNAHVFVDVRAPQGTGIRSESQNGAMTLNRGIVGAF